jgi:hypothetical protein
MLFLYYYIIVSYLNLGLFFYKVYREEGEIDHLHIGITIFLFSPLTVIALTYKLLKDDLNLY